MVLSPEDMETLAKIKSLPESDKRELDSFLSFLEARRQNAATEEGK